MKKLFLLISFAIFGSQLMAQESYTMGFEKAIIEVVDAHFFSEYQFPGSEAMCGIYDKESETFYTCNDKKTFRYVNEDFIKSDLTVPCCERINFDPAQYYGTLTLAGVIDEVNWDDMIVYFSTDKARLVIQVDEREIDALYKKFYEENHLGKVHLILRLNTYDTPNENVLSYNRNTYMKPKPKRTFTKILRW